MIKPEAAQELLKKFQIDVEEDEDDIDEDEDSGSYPHLRKRAEKLPKSLRTVAFGLLCYDAQGKVIEGEEWSDRIARDRKIGAAIDDLAAKDRIKLFETLVPPIGKQIDSGWQFLKALPYQDNSERRGFRAPKDPAATLESRKDWLDDILSVGNIYRPDVITLPWLATWANYVRMGGYAFPGRAGDPLGRLFAAVMSEPGKIGDEVFEILVQSARNEHEIGCMGRHVTRGLLSSSRPEAWDFIEKMLLAAQRQEGLRQHILEVIDEAHPEAFRRMLKLILDHDLVRFSAVARAVDVWFGLRWDSASTKVINETISGVLSLLNDPEHVTRALASSDPELVFRGLWCQAYEDAPASIVSAEKLLNHEQVEVRFVATRHLGEVQLPAAVTSRLRALNDEDLRVAYLAATGSGISDDEEEDLAEPDEKLLGDSAGVFESLEKLLPRLPEKPATLKPLVWPWMEQTVNRKSIARLLVSSLGKRPPTRLIPYLKELESWERRRTVEKLSEQKKWDQLTRDTLFSLAGDAAGDVREVVFESLREKPLQDGEAEKLESLLTRKSSDVRRGTIDVLGRQKDVQALASVDRLLAAKDGNQRLAGLELVRILKDSKRCVTDCLSRAGDYRSHRKNLTKAEETHLAEIEKTEGSTSGDTPDNCLGLADLTKISPTIPPRKRNVEFCTKASLACLKSLDDLIHANRETIVRVKTYSRFEEKPLGTIDYEFPVPSRRHSLDKQKSRIPLLELWETWFASRPKEARDKDGLELVRALVWGDLLDAYDYDEFQAWAKKPENKAFAKALGTEFPKQKYRYLELMLRILPWFELLHPVEKHFEFLLDAAETTLASVPEKEHELLIPKPKEESKKKKRNYYDDDEEPDWRSEKAYEIWPEAMSSYYGEIRQQVPKETFQRIWNMYHWRDRPIAGARRSPPEFEMLVTAYDYGLANIHDLAEQILGPRVEESYSRSSFDELEYLTARKLSKNHEAFLERHPEVRDLIQQAREKVLKTELARGDTQTPLTLLAWSLGCVWGTANLVNLLTAIGKAGFKSVESYYDDKKAGRQPTLTELVKRCYPQESDTAEDFSKQMTAALAAGAFPESRILELAFLAPQWARFIEAYLEWEGFSEGLYWFLAHMNYADEAAEKAALSDESDDDDFDEDNEQDDEFDDDLSSDDDEESDKSDQPKEKLSPWERLILERTPLTDEERSEGAVDIAWFQRTYQELKPKHWQALADAAKFASNAAQAKKAQFLADVLLGKTKRQDLVDGIQKKKLKEYVRLLGLLPLATGTKRDADILERYHVLVGYRQYAKGLSSMTREGALKAAEIGFQNLARTAGYSDPLRLEWAMEADSVKDLAKGSISATKDGVTVTLKIDERFQPELIISRGEKVLKAIPPAVKKDKSIAAIAGRVADLKKQSSRMKQSLETAMCRGDLFSAVELIQLSQHAVLSPMLQRLVLITEEGQLGYPDPNGKSLIDYKGTRTPVKKTAQLRIAHPHDLYKNKDWDKWQHDCFVAERLQPIKQIFRELYVVTKQEKLDSTKSQRYAAQQVNPRQANALWGRRGWQTQDGVWKVFYELGIVAMVDFNYGITTPLEVEGLTLDSISFRPRDGFKPIKLIDVPPRVFSEVMRDIDLVVSVAHRGEVDPEASASTVEMRTTLLRETCSLLNLKNVKLKDNHATIQGGLGTYSVHLGSGTVHKLPGGALCIVPVHAQHRGRVFLPFADDDPRSAEVISKVLLLARDHEILDPSILDQLRNT